jgi:RNA polymerase sigma-70 factor (ECF subfamily)
LDHVPTKEPRDHFADLYQAHYTSVLGYVRRRTRDLQEADDVLGETFLVAWRRLREVPDEPRAWLLGVARRVLANHRRSERRRLGLVERIRREPFHPPSDAAGTADARVGLVRATLEKLRPRDREILMLVEWDELERGEIAELLGCSRASVDVRLHRARERMRALLLESGSIREDASRRTQPAWTGDVE